MRTFVLLTLAVLFSAPPARAAELLMFEEKWCTYCEQWEAEVGVVYHKTEEGRRAPLRRPGHMRVPVVFSKYAYRLLSYR